MNNAKIGAALLGGYALGRTKKAKLAIGLGAALAGSRIRPGQLGKALDAPFLSRVRQQVGSELTDASKAAATSVLTAKAEHLAEALHERTEGLEERAHPGGEGDRGDRGREDEARDEEPEEEEPAEEEEEPEEEEGRAEERQGEERQSRARRSGSATRQKAQHRGSEQEGEPRRKRTAATQSRAKSGTGTSRSRRKDDG